MSENIDSDIAGQISALDDLIAGGVAGSASVIVGRKLIFVNRTIAKSMKEIILTNSVYL